MTTLREAAQQALEALDEAGQYIDPGDSIHPMVCDAADALQAALEQPVPPPEAKTEAEWVAYCAGWWAALEQMRRQPVAWRFRLHPSKVPGSPWRITDHYEDIRVMVERGEWEAVSLVEAA